MQVLEYINDNIPAESAVAFGLHPNAEIGFKLRETDSFCSSLLSMQVRAVVPVCMCRLGRAEYMWQLPCCPPLVVPVSW